MEQNVQPNEQINLSQMPVEILERILIYLDNKQLLNASHVCKLFASVAENAFAQKYSKNVYYLDRFSKREISLLFHEVMLNKYGGKMRNIDLSDKNESINRLIERKCCNLESFDVNDISNIPNLSGLKRMSLCHNLYGNCGWDGEQFTKFINNNKQLECLELSFLGFDVMDILDDQLNMLKYLSYVG